MKMNEISSKDLEKYIREILDRNGFASQKVDSPNPNQPEDFRIRVMQPLKFGVEIIKPKNLRDFVIIGGRLNVSPQHQDAIDKMDIQVRERLFDDLRISLANLRPNYKMDIKPPSKFQAIDVMLPIFIIPDSIGRDIYEGMDIINKMFFHAIFIMQKHFKESGVSIPTTPGQSSSQFYL